MRSIMSVRIALIAPKIPPKYFEGFHSDSNDGVPSLPTFSSFTVYAFTGATCAPPRLARLLGA